MQATYMQCVFYRADKSYMASNWRLDNAFDGAFKVVIILVVSSD